MIKIPDNIKASLKEHTKSPQGTLSIIITFKKNIFDKNVLGGVMFENVAGGQYFRLERSDDLKIKFYHSSSGTGTRLAVADISQSVSSLKVMFTFTWSPIELNIYVGPMDVKNGNLVQGTEVMIDKKFKVTSNEQVLEVGNQVSGILITEGNKIVLDNSAIESWNETIQAIDILLESNSSRGGYMFDVVKSNFACVALVTGFETYCKRRLQEIEDEGIKLNYKKLEEKNKKLTKEEIFAEKTNHFQSLDRAKEIWKNLLDIKVAEINADTWLIFKEKLFPHRHVVSHAHPLRTTMDSATTFVTNEISEIRNKSNEFIQSLHKETLKLSK